MHEIHAILGIKSKLSLSEVKSAYYRRLHKIHPRNSGLDSNLEYIKLVEAYKRFLAGDSYLNCYKIVHNNDLAVSCRCGSNYEIQPSFVGRVDCDFCSCFIIVEEPLDVIAGDI